MTPENTTQPRFALVTGATSGIGFYLAKLLVEDGYQLLIVGRNQATLDQTVQQLTLSKKADIITFQKDLFEKDAATSLYEEVKSRNINVEILINNAGQGEYGEFIHNDIERELDIIHLNIGSLVILTKLFLQDMVQAGRGKILNLSSIASKTPGPLNAVYHGTKAFVQSFTEAVRYEVKDTGVTLTNLLPGATDTDFFDKAGMENSKIVVDGDLADPEKVAKDGYEAMMKGDDMVVSGLKNKATVAMSAVTPDSTLAAAMHKQQKPAEKEQ